MALAALVLVLALGDRDVGNLFIAQGEQGSRPFRQETVAEVLVQGNLLTPDDEVRRLGGIDIGMPFTPDTVAEVAARLRAANRFRRVEVLKRFASIADPTLIVLVVIVDEGAVAIERGDDPKAPMRVVRRRGLGLMYLPVLRVEDGYGFTYGVRLTRPDFLGRRSRLSFPLTWGGDKRAAVEADKEFPAGLVTRVVAGSSVSRRRHPFFEADDDRQQVWVAAEKALTQRVTDFRAGGTAGWQRATFLGETDGFFQTGASLVFDTRLDPMLARNAVYARAAWERSAPPKGHGPYWSGPVNQTVLDARWYAGLPRRSVLMLRALREGSDGPVPPYLKSILGGMPNLRGFRRGTAVGDSLVSATIELRLPISSPLGIGRLGASAFVDVATVYDDGERLEDQTLQRSVGGGLWFSVAFVRLNLAVAHGLGGSTRVHFGTGVSP